MAFAALTSRFEGIMRDPQRSHIAGLFAVLALMHVPALALTGYFADDWSYVFLAKFEDPHAILKMLWEVAHPFYGPWIAFVSLGDIPLKLGRIASLALHCLNCYLLFAVLRQSPFTRRIACLAAALFLVSPFYTIRGPSANSQYDLFITAWLLSVLWMDDARLWRRILAPFCMIVAMGIEPVVMLEPLRILCVWRPGHSVWQVLRKVWVFWAVALAILVLRFTVWVPSGHYAGVRTLGLDPRKVISLLVHSFRHIPFSLKVAGYNTWTLVPSWQLALAAAAAAAAFWRLTPARIERWELLAFPLGIAMFVMAALPYALIGEYLWPYRFESRFAFVAQIGLIIAIVALVQAIPPAVVRKAVAAALLFVCSLSVAGDGKWLLLDEALQRDITARVANAFAAPAQPMVLLLTFEPPSYHVLFRYRCLGANDLNVPIALATGDRRPRSFVYDKKCEASRPYCTISYFDKQPCPERRVEGKYVFDVSRSTIEHLSLWDALGWTGRKPGGRLVIPPG